jgi:flagellar protein FliO/FliZ
MGARSVAAADAPLVQVLSTGYLGPKKSISVVSIAGELLIIGATATDLIPLGRVRNAERVQQLMPHAASSGLQHTVQAGIWMP